MEYTVQQMAKLAGVSARTLRYYDQIALLSPARVNTSGYRIYGREQVDRLQMILFYRELDMPLDEIARLLSAPGFDRQQALEGHLASLNARRERLDKLIHTVRQTIQSDKEGTMMGDKQKFEGFKQQLVAQNEQKYGDEVRRKYGDQTVDESNRKMLNLTEAQFARMQELAQQIQAGLKDAVGEGQSPDGEAGRALSTMHKEWLGFTWPKYSAEAHRNLAQMYLDDERFTAYYDAEQPGCAHFLRDAIHAHISD